MLACNIHVVGCCYSMSVYILVGRGSIALVFSKPRDLRGYLRKVTDLFRGIVRLKHVLISRSSITFTLSETYHGHVVSLKSADRNFREFNPFIGETEVETGGCMIRDEVDEEVP